MTKTLEFPLVISRTRPFDCDVEVFVRAVVRHVKGEPGSAAITAGWVIDECAATDASGAEIDDLSAQEQIEEAVRRECERIQL